MKSERTSLLGPVAPQYLTAREAANFLSVTHRQLESWRAKGCGPRFIKKTRRFLRYSIDDLKSWMEKDGRRSTAQEVSR